MSVRLLTTRLFKHGRFLLQNYWKRNIHNNILEQRQTQRKRSQPLFTALTDKRSAAVRVLNATSSTGTGQLLANINRSPGLLRFGQHARKLIIDNILNRVTTTYSAELRLQATKKLFYGDSAPFFALVGVSLASCGGLLTKEDELEGVCWEIREAASKLQNIWTHDEISERLDDSFNIDKLSIGPAIAKGCAAVVYAAALKSEYSANDIKESTATESTSIKENFEYFHQPAVVTKPELMTPIQNMSRFVHNLSSSVDGLKSFTQTSAATVFERTYDSRNDNENKQNDKNILENENFNNLATVLISNSSSNQEVEVNLQHYPLALKMMFNYNIQSNAMSILKAMYKETIPARQRYLNDVQEMWEQHLQNQIIVLPPHPNIVCMYGYFCDEVGNFPGGHLLYPIAQPQRINPQGYGRNMSLYLLMKRYDNSLRSYLNTNQVSVRDKVLLLTQLLEAITHINRHGIAHRDIKSDNILLEHIYDKDTPKLVLSDFGCCLADREHGLQIPYNTYDIDKGGNTALMAPEIINKQPGAFSILNYAKADLWACGAIAYEIFGLCNPFYQNLIKQNNKENKTLLNSNYKDEDLPPLTEDCPKLVQHLIYNILSPNPSKRVSPDIAANIMQLYLWAPSKWLSAGNMPNSSEILQWLLSLTTKVLCEAHSLTTSTTTASLISSIKNYQQTGRRTYVEYILICSFLARAHLRRIRCALNWIQNVA